MSIWTKKWFVRSSLVVFAFGISVHSAVLASIETTEQTDHKAPQCGHWAILRTCELLGVPTDIRTIIKMLPPRQSGHSMLELAKVLRRIGLKTSGKRVGFEELTTGSFPVVVHLKPDHFVTISKIDGKHIYIFDMSGRVVVLDRSEFENIWDGSVLTIQRPSDNKPLPVFLKRGNSSGPCIQFDRLIIDKGEVPWDGKPLVYDFTFRNIGQTPLVIEKVNTSCGCLGSDKPKQPVPSGKKAKITLRYNLKDGQGPFMHKALVKSNDPWVPYIRLTAAGNTSTKVRVTPSYGSFGEVVGGTMGMSLVFAHHTGDLSLEILDAYCKNKKISVTHYVLTEDVTKQIWPIVRPCKGCVLNPRNTHVIHMSLKPDISECGTTVKDTLVICTNIKGFEKISIPLFAKVVYPVSLYPDVLLYVDVGPDMNVTKRVIAMSHDSRPFRIVSMDTKYKGMRYSVSKTSMQNSSEIMFSAKGATVVSLIGKEVEIKLEMLDTAEHITLKLPVYAYERKPQM